MADSTKNNRFATYAIGVVGYNLLVVLWGAYVRATGSGAGCGSHWPLCNGVVMPRPERIETVIEFSHRVTSGLALLAVVGLLVWAFRAYPKGHRVRGAAIVSMGFMLLEAALGAGLVLFGLVEENASVFRAFSMSAHLVNTFLLIGALTITAWWATGAPALRFRDHDRLLWPLVGGLVGMIVLGITGGIAALGDTLFPSTSLVEGIRADFSGTAHFL
ncbi:MAG TPA: COX15/CtaA family protein, partial [Longimicrobiaceae bacterium]|nr:COX15/CtaA family protein [Longimicrobiaceae bacterium]